MLPAGPKIAFSGGDTTDHGQIWATLDQIHTKHPDMVLIYGGTPKEVEKIAALWADNRKVPQIVFRPDWTKHAHAAPFKRNDQMLSVMPIRVIIFPGRLQGNLADKAHKLGIPVYRFGGAAHKRRFRFSGASDAFRLHHHPDCRHRLLAGDIRLAKYDGDETVSKIAPDVPWRSEDAAIRPNSHLFAAVAAHLLPRSVMPWWKMQVFRSLSRRLFLSRQ